MSGADNGLTAMEILDVVFYTVVLAIALYISSDSGGGTRGRIFAGIPA